MANVIKIKRSSATAAPPSLNDGELAFSFLSGKLFIGNTTAVIPIGGTHSPGTLTANQALVANSTSGIDKVIVANLNIQELRANNNVGTAGFLLTSAGAGANAYWINPSTLTTAAAGSNTQIQFNNSGAFGADANFTFDTATDVLTVGNSTVNAAINSTSIVLASGPRANTTGVYPASNTVGAELGDADQRFIINANTINASDLATLSGGMNTTTANASVAMNVGANVSVNTSAFFVGNSTVNSVLTSSSLSTGNTTITGFANVSGTLNVNGNVTLGDSFGVDVITVNATIGTELSPSANNTLRLGRADLRWGEVNANNVLATNAAINTILTVGANVTANTTALFIGNSTVNTVITSTSVVTGTANAATAMNVGANVNLSTSQVSVGNSTVNAVHTATGFTIASGVTANTSGVYPSSNTVGTALGSTSQRWIVIANTVNTSGNVGVGGDLTVSGNLTVSGTLTTIDTVNLTIKDPLIKLANNNLSDAVDLGFYGVYTDGTTQFAAFFRDASDSDKFKLYNGLTNEPSTTVDLTGGSLATLVLGTLEATNITLTNPLTVPNGGTGAGTFTTRGVIYGNGTSALQVTAAGTDGQVLQANSTGFPVFADLDGGTF